MKTNYIVSLAVGGTNTDAGLVRMSDKTVLYRESIPSPSDQSAEEIVRQFDTLIDRILKSPEKFKVAPGAVAVAMPDPLDYVTGMSLLNHKFPSLRGHNLKQLLEAQTELPFYLVNDADAFALGAHWVQTPSLKRLIGVTIGTGIGGGFIEDGQIVFDDRVPPDGEMWDCQIRGKNFEDYISTAGIMAEYEVLSNQAGVRPEEIEKRARAGEKTAIQMWEQLGQIIGEGLADAAPKFIPDTVVFGGKISRAFDLFGPIAEKTYADKIGVHVPFHRAESEDLAILGAAYFASQN